MKIVVPLSSEEHYQDLVQAGADEFYCGYVDMQWLDKGNEPVNRRELFNNTNITSLDSMKILHSMVSYYDKPVAVAFNSIQYSPQRYPQIEEKVNQLLQIGFDRFIIGDIGLLYYLKESGLNCSIHLSGEMGILNADAIFFLKEYPFTRVIFPRKVKIEEIKQIISTVHQDTLEYECFILNNNCDHNGCFCFVHHEADMCQLCFLPCAVDESVISKFKKEQKCLSASVRLRSSRLEQLEGEGKHVFGDNGCGLCFMSQLEMAGITHIKMVGRGGNTQDTLCDLKRLRDLLDRHPPESPVLDKRICTNKNCYFPEDRMALRHKGHRI